MGLPDPESLNEAFNRDLAGLVEDIRAGRLPADVVDQATAERWLLRLVGVLLSLQERHKIDKYGLCAICRKTPHWWWPWPTRTTCTVYKTLRFFLRQPGWAVLSVIADGYLTVRHTL